MNRIYQGRVAEVQTLKPGSNGKSPDDLEILKDWQSVLWKHHELFQDAVNYYTLALAALADGLKSDSPKGKAALAWREQVRDAWLKAKRKALWFPGPHARLAKWFRVDPTETEAGRAFDKCAAALLKNSPSSVAARAKALLQMLEEVDQSDLNQFCVSRLPWLCTPHGKLDATPKNVVQQQETRMLAIVKEVHEAALNEIDRAAGQLELGYFVTQMPKERMKGREALAEAQRLFASAAGKAKVLTAIADKFAKRLEQLGEQLELPRLGRKPKGAYPLAVVFKLFPGPETWEAFKFATGSLYKKAEKLKGAPTEIAADHIAEARTDADQPLFDYFTNIALYREPDNDDRAVWFEFDLAAFIEAIKAPHRYFQDTLAREKAAEVLRKKKLAMEGDGCDLDDEGEEDEEGGSRFGFKGDTRIELLKELVKETLGYVAETEDPNEEPERVEYTIQERTLRAFAEIKERWRKLSAKGQANEDDLQKILAEVQGKHRDDFGSATLYRALAQPRYQSIWRAEGTEKWHATDPLKAWRTYRELCFELEDKERLIRFTPAHPEHSPRFFIIPKQGRFGSEHIAGNLAFNCGIANETERGWEVGPVRVSYSAPRLCRDELRHESGEDLEHVPWLQPMMKALDLPHLETQDFANCRVTLQPESSTNIQLTFPVEVNPDKLIDGIGKAARWNRQFNVHPDGDNFHDATLRWPHEKKPAKPPPAWHDALDGFTVLATDLGQRDAGAYALLEARANAGFGKKPSRFIGESEGKKWRAALLAAGMLRLSGENRIEWRAPSTAERARGETEFGWREELYGERGRSASPEETRECHELLKSLDCDEKDFMPEGWETSLSFPKQNSKLLIAVRRAQSRLARLHRWCWFLTDKKHDSKAGDVFEEIAGLEDESLLSSEVKKMAAEQKREPLLIALKIELRKRSTELPDLLVKVANRCLPLRGRSWKWVTHPAKADCYLLEQTAPPREGVQLRGQRGLSFERIEQIEELRRRFQSLNQILRREPGGPPPKRRDDAVPDPCPDLLEKLDELKRQRVNQTAHLILAQALGVRLAPPPADKAVLKRTQDQHGIYEKFREPVDFIVIEDLSRYRASQGRAPRENGRLMKWCHRSVRDKLRELCEPFGIPVLETPAAWSSRFCSRSGAAGFRGVEVAPSFDLEAPWCWIKNKKEGEIPSAEAESVMELIRQVNEANKGRDGANKKFRTLLAPLTGGPIFVPISDSVSDADIQPAIAQADINAAINLGLRAIADPRLWSIHPRLRTQRDKKDGSLSAKEKRKFGEKNPPKLSLSAEHGHEGKQLGNPNFFADHAGCVDTKAWGEATLPDGTQLVSGKALWITIKQRQWQRVREINLQRIINWRNKEDGLPM